MFNAFTENRWGELPAADCYAVAAAIRNFVESRRLQLDLDIDGLASSIIGYIQLRHRFPAHQISNPQRRKRTCPEGWTAQKDRIWMEWLLHYFSLNEWQTEVMYEVFGTEQSVWESHCNGWREELYAFLPWWIRRDDYIFERIDPTPLPGPEENAGRLIDMHAMDQDEGGGRRGGRRR